MPLPKPKKGEKQNAFVSRCISQLDDEGSSLSQEQRVAACFSQWRKSKQKMNLKFNYTVPFVSEGIIDDQFIIAGTAINSTITSNNHKFLPEELNKSAVTLKGVPLLKDHRNEVDAIVGRVLEANFDEETESIPFKAKVNDETVKKLIKRGDLNTVSIGAEVSDIEESEDGVLIPRGIKFKELSLVAVPADEGATFSIALKEAYSSKLKSSKEVGGGETPHNIDQRKVTDMETLRKKMGLTPAQFYAAPRDPPSSSALPIFDAAHTRNAMARFNQTKFKSPEERARARQAILRAAKKFGINADNFKKATQSYSSKLKGGLKMSEEQVETAEEEKSEETSEPESETKSESEEESVDKAEEALKLIKQVAEEVKRLKEADKDEVADEPETKEEETSEPEEESDEEEEDEDEEEVDEVDEGYRIVQGTGSIKGGSFTVIRNKY